MSVRSGGDNGRSAGVSPAVAWASRPRPPRLRLRFRSAFCHDVKTSMVRERDAPATAGETPALRPEDRLSLSWRAPVDGFGVAVSRKAEYHFRIRLGSSKPREWLQCFEEGAR